MVDLVGEARRLYGLIRQIIDRAIAMNSKSTVGIYVQLMLSNQCGDYICQNEKHNLPSTEADGDGVHRARPTDWSARPPLSSDGCH
jgi:hypothetical protein